MHEVSSFVDVISEIGRFHGKDYLNRLVSKLASLIGADHVYISRLGDNEMVSVVAGWESGQLNSDFSYPLATTPCYELVAKGACVYNLDLKPNFPNDQFIFDADLNSYIGLALTDVKGNKIGILTALYHGEISDQERTIGIFEIVGIRASAELERLSYENNLLKSNEELLNTNREFSLFKKIVQSSDNGIVVTDSQYKIISSNPAFSEITQVTSQDLSGSTYRFSEFFQKFNKFEKKILTDPRLSKTLEVTKISMSYTEGPEVDRSVFFCRDITEEKKANDILSHYAKFDALTSLSSRFSYSELVNQHIYEQPGTLKSIIVFSIDNFKSINETMGHIVGDELLKTIANKLYLPGLTVPPGRVGGNEFSIFVDCIDRDCVIKFLDEIYQRVSGDTKILGVSIPVTISAGSAFYPDNASDVEDLINCASQALTQSKKMGPNNHTFFLPQLKTISDRFSTVYQKLATLLAGDKLNVNYQAIVDLNSGVVCGAEALARWTDSELGCISPVEFIEVAEQTGLIYQLGEQVFRQAAEFSSHLKHDCKINIPISVNCSPCEILNKPELHKNKFSLLKKLNIDVDSIHIELTENVMVEDKNLAVERMVALSESGFSLSIDDFGTGFSSLSYLKDYPFDVLKIDRSFISDISSDEGSRNIVRIIIDLAKSFNVKVIAEGVSNKEQLDILTTMGCDMAQGFYFHRPESGNDFSARLQQLENLKLGSEIGFSPSFNENTMSTNYKFRVS